MALHRLLLRQIRLFCRKALGFLKSRRTRTLGSASLQSPCAASTKSLLQGLDGDSRRATNITLVTSDATSAPFVCSLVLPKDLAMPSRARAFGRNLNSDHPAFIMVRATSDRHKAADESTTRP
jgi:hypothetical protein